MSDLNKEEEVPLSNTAVCLFTAVPDKARRGNINKTSPKISHLPTFLRGFWGVGCFSLDQLRKEREGTYSLVVYAAYDGLLPHAIHILKATFSTIV